MAQAPRPLDAPTRERPDRAEATETHRRRRKGGEDGTQARMRVPPEMMEDGGACDPKKWALRWVNDDRMRLHDLTKSDDWEIVSSDGSTGTVDSNTAVRYLVGAKADGAPMFAYLCRKLKVFADQDSAEKVKQVDEREAARLKRTPGDAPDQSYTPKR